MENKNPIYIGAGIIILLLLGIVLLSSGILNGNTSKNFESEQITNPELEKYRSKDIPEDCRLPNYENDVREWTEHLSHHKQTWYCLNYYGTSIEEMNG